MRRTKERCATLTKDERRKLVDLEYTDKHSIRSAYIAPDCTECGYCSTPHLGYGLCPICSAQLIHIIKKKQIKNV